MLISRFSDREETVRLEVWSTYATLLNQTSLYGGMPEMKDDSPRGKRKRDSEELMELEETPYTLLKTQVPSLSKALLNQLKSPKTNPVVLQSGFSLLKTLLEVLPGSLSSQVGPIISTSKAVLSQSPTTSTSTLHITNLAFLALFFSTHPASAFQTSLSQLTGPLLKSVAERHPRIASETFRVFSALLNAVKPSISEAWPSALYDEAIKRLSNHDTDAEVRACSEDCIADLWICSTELMQSKDRKEWEYICRSTGKTDSAVRVITKVATEVYIGDEWVNGCLTWILTLLKKSGRLGKVDAFTALEVLLRR